MNSKILPTSARPLFFQLVTILVVSLTSFGNLRADVVDRINACENQQGSNGCVYDLLRELARNSGTTPDQITSYCTCVSASGDSGALCNGLPLGATLVLTIENTTTGSEQTKKLQCFAYGAFDPVSSCQSALRSHPRCRQ